MPSACHLFDLVKPSTADVSRRVQAHMLRLWIISARVFEEEDTANLWATGVVNGSASTRDSAASAPCASSDPPLSLLHPPTANISPQVTLLRSFSAGVESLVDQVDP